MTAKSTILYLLAMMMVVAPRSDAAENLQTNQQEQVPNKKLAVIVDQDMEKLSLGVPKWETGLINNTWTGNPCEIKIVDTATEFGKALEIDVSYFAQISLGGPYKVGKGVKLRVSGSIMSQPPMEYALDLSRGPMCFMVNGKAMEQWKTFNYIIETRDACPDAYVHIRIFGMGKMWIGGLKVEEYAGTAAEMKPPVLGNMLQNSSFEIGMDGVWYRPAAGGGRAFVDEKESASGSKSLCLEGNGNYSSAYYPVAYGQPYVLSFSAKADYDNAGAYVEFVGPTTIGGGHRIPKGKWTRITLPYKIGDPKGLVFENPAASIRIGEGIPKGCHLWIDDIDLRYGTNAVYAPAYETEYALSTDKPHNRMDVNAPFTLKIRGTRHGVAGAKVSSSLPLTIKMLDESNQEVKTWDVDIALEGGSGGTNRNPSFFANYSGALELKSGLPEGYWRFVTVPGDARNVRAKLRAVFSRPKEQGDAKTEFAPNQGEALVAVIPALPEQTPATWPVGTHASALSIDSSYGTRIIRLHDCTQATRWWVVEPEKGKWTWKETDETIENYRKAGFRILAVLDGVAPWRTGTGKRGGSALEYPDRDFTDWRNYVRAMVSRYKGQVDAWEICNEPSVWGKSFDGEKNTTWYVELLKNAYQAAKEADPSAIVVGGGGASQVEKNNIHWKEMIGAGLFSQCDIVSYHGYGRAGSAMLEDQAILFDFMDWINAEMKAKIGKTLPVWDTEIGFGPRTSSWKFWQPNREGHDPVEAARTIAVSRACEQFKGVDKSFYYHGWHYLLTEMCGLLNFHDANLQLTPLTVTLPVVIRELDGLLPAAKERQGTANILKFESPERAPNPRTVWMIWTLKTQQPVEVMVPEHATVSAVNLFGRPLKVAVRDGKVALAAGPWPIYLSAAVKR
jgi:hypothetical protein